MFKKLNQNPHFMQMLKFLQYVFTNNYFSYTIYNFDFPFEILIKMQGVKLTFSAYFSSIKLLLKK